MIRTFSAKFTNQKLLPQFSSRVHGLFRQMNALHHNLTGKYDVLNY